MNINRIGFENWQTGDDVAIPQVSSDLTIDYIDKNGVAQTLNRHLELTDVLMGLPANERKKLIKNLFRDAVYAEIGKRK